jgi:hypothetical protein
MAKRGRFLRTALQNGSIPLDQLMVETVSGLRE